MKRKYWALLVFALIIVLQWIGLGFHGQIRFYFFDNYISSNCFIGNIITEIVKVNINCFLKRLKTLFIDCIALQNKLLRTLFAHFLKAIPLLELTRYPTDKIISKL